METPDGTDLPGGEFPGDSQPNMSTLKESHPDGAQANASRLTETLPRCLKETIFASDASQVACTGPRSTGVSQQLPAQERAAGSPGVAKLPTHTETSEDESPALRPRSSLMNLPGELQISICESVSSVKAVVALGATARLWRDIVTARKETISKAMVKDRVGSSLMLEAVSALHSKSLSMRVRRYWVGSAPKGSDRTRVILACAAMCHRVPPDWPRWTLEDAYHIECLHARLCKVTTRIRSTQLYSHRPRYLLTASTEACVNFAATVLAALAKEAGPKTSGEDIKILRLESDYGGRSDWWEMPDHGNFSQLQVRQQEPWIVKRFTHVINSRTADTTFMFNKPERQPADKAQVEELFGILQEIRASMDALSNGNGYSARLPIFTMLFYHVESYFSKLISTGDDNVDTVTQSRGMAQDIVALQQKSRAGTITETEFSKLLTMMSRLVGLVISDADVVLTATGHRQTPYF